MTQAPNVSQVHCIKCGYNLTGVVIGGTCPECGAPINTSFLQANTQPSGFALAALVLGIVSIPTFLCYGVVGLICGILAIIFWRVSVVQTRNGTRSSAWQGLARAGMICGIIGIVLGLAMMIVFGVIIGNAIYRASYISVAVPPSTPYPPVPMQPQPAPNP